METDISKCFDEIDHQVMLNGVVLPKEALKGLRKAVKAGVRGEYPDRIKGTPQGGVISPLLANIALDGFENLGSDQWKRRRSRPLIRGIRYADDAVFIYKPEADTKKLREDIDEFLKSRGLRINETKTKVSKATEGFDFLGWRFRVNSRGVFKSTPSSENYADIKAKVKATWRNGATTEARLKRIESQIRGWRQYHKNCDMSKHSLWSLNHWVWRKLRVEKRRKAIKEAEKARRLAIKGKPLGAAKRQLTSEQIKKAFPTVPWKVNDHVMVKGDASPFNGNTSYWVGRNSKLYRGPTAEALRRQKNICPHCNRKFMELDGAVELHHIDGNHNNWKPKNLVALHRECHQAQAIHCKRIKDGLAKRVVKT